MEHLNMQSMDKVAANVAKIRELFPNCVTERINIEGKLEHAIDFDMLKQELSDHVVDGLQERYQFTWPDKRKAILAANTPINEALRPCREESVDFDNTENLYIEGDNLKVLKLLQETYLGKVKMIYIDPPYNTGNDFVYRDEFKKNASEYKNNSGQRDKEGNRLVTNTESNGRFHTNWLNMIYPRLKLAKDLLSDDGVIFISIDDNEVENLRKICDEIFGENNFLAQIIWERAFAPVNLKKHFSPSHDYIICYANNIDNCVCNGLKRDDSSNARYANPDNDSRGVWTSGDLSVGPAVPEKIYEIITPSGRSVYPPSGYCWRLDKNTFFEYLKDKRIWFGENGDNVPRIKRFLSEVKQGITPMTIWKFKEVGSSQDASRNLKKLFDDKAFFEYPKSVPLIERCIQLYSNEKSLILDFFSGSATTAHAVMQLNAEDGGKRKFIMVQIPEISYVGKKTKIIENGEVIERYVIDEETGYPIIEKDSNARKNGYWNVCEIGKERIRRAGKKIKEENPLTTQDLDIGFRVLKCDSSNMEDVYFTPKEYMDKQQSLFVDNIKKDRSDEDLLFDAMLKLDTPLSSKIEKRSIAGKTVYNVAQGHLMACFDQDVTDEVITAIAKEMPSYFVMRDSSLANDSVSINFEQIFNTYSPLTVRRVL
ncbi:site-specific DNA-methyltransferase [Phascolarctobacterium succinatutens]|uniref:site-specific DNA-methyltransferase n=1 Tax=Phascolarctobacterium succinatutens TaxID=626940 RepID=UPI003AB65A15